MTISLPLAELSNWFLVSIRVLAVFTVAPIFGHPSVSARLRVGIALGVALAISPTVDSGVDLFSSEPGALALLVGRELAIGLAMGFVSSLIFSSFGLLGQFISVQGGLGAARVVDPASGAATVVIGVLLQTFGLLTFLAIDGHHALIRAIAASFERMPFDGPGLSTDGFIAIAHMGGTVFEVAVRLAAPVTVAMLVSNCALGLLGRSIQQLNLMTLQLPAHVAILMVLLALGARTLVDSMSEILLPWMNDIPNVVAGYP